MGFNSCALKGSNGRFTNSSVQSIDMGKFISLRTVEIASLNYPEFSESPKTQSMFTQIDKANFSDSLIQSFKRSEVRVLPSAQTKIHIDFTQLVLPDEKTNFKIIMNAKIVISRNGTTTRKFIEISSQPKMSIGSTKDKAVQLFILELAELLREQSSFKR